jgi:hypothetical protein
LRRAQSAVAATCGFFDFGSPADALVDGVVGVVSSSAIGVVEVVSSSDVDDRDVEGKPFRRRRFVVVAEPVDAAEVPASDDESDPPVSATATPGLLATAAPIPRATASAPTRPVDVADDGACRRRPIVTGNGLH